MYTEHKRKVHIGDMFGQLTVLEFSHISEKGRHAYWVCECSCGNTTVVRGNHLRSGNCKTCGCTKHMGVKDMVDVGHYLIAS